MLERFRSGGTFTEWESPDGDLMRYLLSTGHIRSDCRISQDFYKATEAGLAYLAALEQEVKDRTARERQQRFQNQISVAQVLVPAITFVLGLVVEHFSGIVGALWRLVENLVK